MQYLDLTHEFEGLRYYHQYMLESQIMVTHA